VLGQIVGEGVSKLDATQDSRVVHARDDRTSL
jgi:hypothetical protein